MVASMRLPPGLVAPIAVSVAACGESDKIGDAGDVACVMGTRAQEIDGVEHPPCGCCPIGGGFCSFGNGGARGSRGDCGILNDAAPPCHTNVDDFGCPIVSCSGGCQQVPSPPRIVLSCAATGDVCRSGVVHRGGVDADAGDIEISVESPCGPGTLVWVSIDEFWWSPAACPGAATFTATCAHDRSPGTLELDQDVGLAFEQPAAGTAWQAGSEHVVRVRLAPGLATLVGASRPASPRRPSTRICHLSHCARHC